MAAEANQKGLRSVDCGEFDDQITPAVDGRLLPSASGEFHVHAAACPGCRCAYELEAFTKEFVTRSLPLVPVPLPLLQQLLGLLKRARDGGPAA